MSADLDHWEFWIDVGGTFADCLGRRPDGALVAHKILSTGVYKTRIRAGSTTTRLRLEGLKDAPPGFFDAFTLRILAADGAAADTATVAAHAADLGELSLATPLRATPAAGATIELQGRDPAPALAVRWLLGLGANASTGKITVRLGTTRGTNALLERQGARVALVTTAGFEDVLEIATQNRPRLFDLNIRKPRPLYERVVPAGGRLRADGSELTAMDRSALAAELAAAKAAGIDSLAVCLLHSHKNPAHERIAAELAAAAGFGQISVSSTLTPLQRIVPRGDTTVVDAYLTPVIRAYVQSIRAALPEADLRLMTSAGSLVAAGEFVGKDSILSGPAGGVVGAAAVARLAGAPEVIGFDMGGTSTDVCRWAGQFERRYEMELTDPERGAGCRIVAPMLAIETVAAGGGSICDFDGERLTVGPRSAGADPGPACYGRGGPLTITDCNVACGRVLPDLFPLPLDLEAPARRLAAMAATIARATGRVYQVEELAAAYLTIAANAMAQPIRKISVARGFDVRRHALVAFGGAGAQHACRLADELGMMRVLVHPQASFLSAYGIGTADIRRFAARDLGVTLSPEALTMAGGLMATLVRDCESDLRGTESLPEGARIASRRSLDMRYAGQDTALTIDEPADGDWGASFAVAHQRHYGFVYPDRAVEIRAARVEVIATLPRPTAETASTPRGPANARRVVQAWFDGGPCAAPVWHREDLAVDQVIRGPALIVEPSTCLVLERHWTARRQANGLLEALRDQETASSAEAGTGAASPRSVAAPDAAAGPDPVNLALFVNRFTAIAEDMGAALRRTALSVNVKERLDFSCALFAPDGGLVVNAPHIPVHLGSMGDTVRAVLAEAGSTMRPGDVFITNDPYRGGSHLPDVTVITPVYDEAGRQLLFFTGSRAHHAEIGGIAAGSMPPDAKNLAEEGVLIRCFRLVSASRASEEELARLLGAGPWPSRSVETNLGDVAAQIAANEIGRQRLLELTAEHGLATVRAYMGHIRAATARKTRQALARLAPGARAFADTMDDGTPIRVTATLAHAGTAESVELLLDFTGTGPVNPGNLNANTAIVKAATLYALRCLIGEELPLNEGVLEPVRFEIPSPSILRPPAGDDPAKLAAVNAGNVETSQRLVDVLLGAFGLAAASQGTMNNLLFGRAPVAGRPGFGYYETICGGAGAGPGFDGASAVHTHMTNTRITDVEVLEERFPVRVRRFAIRAGSGGGGRWRGGDGVVRELEFLEPLEVSIITSRRTTSPWGGDGGGAGKPGANTLLRRDGRREVLPAMARTMVEAGDILTLETPGGGGWGVSD